MNCLKCGREIPAQQVFCESCLKEMAGQPVKPGTLVLLPVRNVPQPPGIPKNSGPSQDPRMSFCISGSSFTGWLGLSVC